MKNKLGLTAAWAVMTVVGFMAPTGDALAAGRSLTGNYVTSVGTGWSEYGVIVRVTTNHPVVGGCGGSAFIIDNRVHPMSREMLSLLISAKQTGSSVDLYSVGCLDGFMLLNAVNIL